MAANLGAITGYTLSGLMISYFGWQIDFFDQCAYRNFSAPSGDYLRLKEVSFRPVGEKIRLRRFDFVLHRRHDCPGSAGHR